MKKNILYIGNYLKHQQSNESYMQTLGYLLSLEGYTLCYASSKTNKLLRLLDMICTVFLKRKQVDIVLIDTYSTLNFYYAYVISQLCRGLGLAYIPILHGGNLATRLINSPRLSHAIFDHSHSNVAPSMYLKTAFEATGFKNILHIPNVIDIKNYPFNERNFHQPRLLWVRSFSNIYQPELAVRVLKQLLDTGWNASLCMVGPDSDGSLADVKSLAKQLAVDVRFTGKLSKTEWLRLSQNYNLFLNTTTIDNTPLSVIEAMALGLPIVSTNVGGLPYLIRHEIDGLLVPPSNADAMVEAIELVFKNEALRTSIITNARAKAEGFDWVVVKSKWITLLSD